jgi:hypothetical protein
MSLSARRAIYFLFLSRIFRGGSCVARIYLAMKFSPLVFLSLSWLLVFIAGLLSLVAVVE